ncbi:hypothetical protein P170DRAFT_87591 [Aspergillus steynii IBT 23096]|uniref:Uncharacterized protein n=1 Tax=Aspergillus steynii IBT 23096 TaxID=1392250 RepID=A0A2I2GFX3_9EURO|nr:uncharacterized protein P170DRAFT_87591 [Aspergillus steynii IBT 23096]PLB51784.1 hypothetical protein P170DRAFT_87591 [Aspergillus steynii IBT 23096]
MSSEEHKQQVVYRNKLGNGGHLSKNEIKSNQTHAAEIKTNPRLLGTHKDTRQLSNMVIKESCGYSSNRMDSRERRSKEKDKGLKRRGGQEGGGEEKEEKEEGGGGGGGVI